MSQYNINYWKERDYKNENVLTEWSDYRNNKDTAEKKDKSVIFQFYTKIEVSNHDFNGKYKLTLY